MIRVLSALILFFLFQSVQAEGPALCLQQSLHVERCTSAIEGSAAVWAEAQGLDFKAGITDVNISYESSGTGVAGQAQGLSNVFQKKQSRAVILRKVLTSASKEGMGIIPKIKQDCGIEQQLQQQFAVNCEIEIQEDTQANNTAQIPMKQTKIKSHNNLAMQIGQMAEKEVAKYQLQLQKIEVQAGIDALSNGQLAETAAAAGSNGVAGSADAGGSGNIGGETADWVKPAAIGAVAVGGYMLYDNKRDKDKKKAAKNREKKKKRDEANGIITTGSGERIECKKSNNVGKAECGKFLSKYCASEGGTPSVGCMAFQSHKCSMNSTTQFCVLMDSKKHCAQSGSMIGQSPACQWVSSRPSSCNNNLENVNCLSSHTSDALNLSCPDFPADPLCKAHYNGAVVSAPNLAPPKTVVGGTTPSPMPEVPSQEGVILDNTLPPSAQDTIIANSNLLQQLCLDGSLYSCEPARNPSSGQ